MASPPYRSPAASPPYPSHSILPPPARKRPKISTHLPISKRRKPASYSASSSQTLHPLRQTSFPPEESTRGREERSPSVSSDFTAVTGAASVVTNAVGRRGKGKRKRGAGSVRSGLQEPSVGRSVTGVLEEDEDDGEDDGGADNIVDEGGRVDKVAEKKKMAVLIDAFNEDQSERYNTYRRVKLKKETVRRIVNQTLSQSVPPSVITTINGYAKVFLGTLIERALDLQAQSARAEKSLPSSPPSTLQITRPDSSATEGASQAFSVGLSSPQADTAISLFTPRSARRNVSYLAPLQPRHLREAHRRYRQEGEGGGAGMEASSLGLGLPGAGAARLRGRRIFR